MCPSLHDAGFPRRSRNSVSPRPSPSTTSSMPRWSTTPWRPRVFATTPVATRRWLPYACSSPRFSTPIIPAALPWRD